MIIKNDNDSSNNEKEKTNTDEPYFMKYFNENHKIFKENLISEGIINSIDNISTNSS